MTLLPDLPPHRRHEVAPHPEGVQGAVRRGRALRRHALVPLSAVLAVAAVALVATVVRAGSLPGAAEQVAALPVGYAADGPSTYVALTVPARGGNGVEGWTLTLRSVRTGAVLRTVPFRTSAGAVALYSRGERDLFLLRQPEQAAGGLQGTCGGTLLRVDARTGTERTLLDVPPDRGVAALAPSSGNRRLAYVLARCAGGGLTSSGQSLHVRDLGSGTDVARTVRAPGPVGSLSWSPDGSRLAVATGDSTAGLEPAPREGPVLREPPAVVLHTAAGCVLNQAVWADDGIHAVRSCGTGTRAVQDLVRYDDAGRSRGALRLPPCSLGTGATADVQTHQVLVWVNSTSDCPPMNRVLRLRAGRLVDVPLRQSGTLSAATW